MSDIAKEGPTEPLPERETVEVSIRPLREAGAGVYEITVKIDDREPSMSVVRTSPRQFAFQNG